MRNISLKACSVSSFPSHAINIVRMENLLSIFWSFMKLNSPLMLYKETSSYVSGSISNGSTNSSHSCSNRTLVNFLNSNSRIGTIGLMFYRCNKIGLTFSNTSIVLNGFFKYSRMIVLQVSFDPIFPKKSNKLSSRLCYALSSLVNFILGLLSALGLPLSLEMASNARGILYFMGGFPLCLILLCV